MTDTGPQPSWTTIGRELAVALAFLTRLPAAWLRVDAAEAPDFRAAARAFPLAGAIVGAIGGVVLLLASALHLPPLPAALLAVAATILLTGALHEDGLADTADGLGGGANVAARLEIMRDSRIGTFGAVALILSIGLRAALLAALIPLSPLAAAFALVAAETVGRTAIVHIAATLPSARPDGLAATTGQPGRDTLWAAVILAIAIGLVAGTIAAGLLAAIVGLAGAALATYAFEDVCRKRIGGQTGDTLGAGAQFASISFLVLVTAFAT